ncbi:hypothetical protein GCM10025777_28420 [Membranihabitans marinus]
MKEQHIIARFDRISINNVDPINIEYNGKVTIISDFSDFLDNNAEEIIRDCKKLEGNINYHSSQEKVFIHSTAKVDQVIMNTDRGPIFIGKGTHIMDGAILKGPIAIMDHSIVKMGSKIYPGTTIGPHCTVAGEIKNSIIHECTNKGHEGYLGDSILGRWNNLGGGTTVSNVSNTFMRIKTQDWNTGKTITLPTIKRGVITGDFVKTGIITKINSGTKIGSFSSIINSRAITGNIPPLTWLTDNKNQKYLLDKAKTHAQNQMILKSKSWNDYWENQLQRHLNEIQKPMI